MRRLCTLCTVLHHPLCTGGRETDGIHRVLVVAHGGIQGSLSCTMLLSLAVATLMLSQVMARMFRDEDTNDAS